MTTKSCLRVYTLHDHDYCTAVPVPGTQVMYFELLDGIYLNLFFSCRSNNEWVPPYHVPGTLKLTYLCVYK